MTIRAVVCSVLLAACTAAFAEILNVPQQYDTIQAAIDAAENLDQIVLSPGTYSGSGNTRISFRGKTLTVRSAAPTNATVINTTIVDGGGTSPGFNFFWGETRDSRIEGISIINTYGSRGGAIYCYNNSGVTISNCVLANNRAVMGGAIASTSSTTAPLITNCIIKNNSAIVGGGALYFSAGAPIIKNCIILDNSAPNGGAIYAHYGTNPTILNCTILNNNATSSAGALYCHSQAQTNISNTIFWGNNAPDAPEIRLGNSSEFASAQISYCDIADPNETIVSLAGAQLIWGQGNIQSDPAFAASDYHLSSDSPCIDAGDPDYSPLAGETDIDYEPRVSGGVLEIGADEISASLIIAEIRVAPHVLRLESKGNYVKCFIRLPEGFDVNEIKADSIRLNTEVWPIRTKLDLENQQFIASFRRQNVIRTLDGSKPSAAIEIQGNLQDGTLFTGQDTVKLCKAKKAKSTRKRPNRRSHRNSAFRILTLQKGKV